MNEFKEKVHQETIALFREVEELLEARDFYLERVGDWYALGFTPALGYRSFWKYEPLVRYSFSSKAWECRIGRTRFFTSVCPFSELIRELRGYTLAGTVSSEDVVLDAGPWNGISGMYFCAAADRGKVLFMEPDKASADFVAADLAVNGFTNYKLLRKGLYSSSGEVGFVHQEGGESRIDESAGQVTIACLSLQDLVADHVPGGIDFFKVDIEGAEVGVADDLARYICGRPGSWAAIASYHEVNGVKSYISLEECFSRYPELVFKTVFPYHLTTFVAHAANEEVAGNIRKLPDFEVGWKAVQRQLKKRA